MKREDTQFLVDLLNDWAAYYAPEQFKTETVVAARKRVQDRGSFLFYNATGLDILRKELKKC